MNWNSRPTHLDPITYIQMVEDGVVKVYGVNPREGFYCQTHRQVGYVARSKDRVRKVQDSLRGVYESLDGPYLIRCVLSHFVLACLCDPGTVTEPLTVSGTGGKMAAKVDEALGGVLKNTKVICPYGGRTCPRGKHRSLWATVIHLNDYHKWTRERIADWVEDSGLNFEFPAPETTAKEEE